MTSKKGLLKKSWLYVIIDRKTCANNEIILKSPLISKGGADLIQYRDKDSSRETIIKNALLLRNLLLKTRTLFIVNDYLDVAKITDSDGLHLGQGDLPIEIARKILGRDKIIGISCHTLKQAVDAQKRGADYIGIGPIFKTPTKPAITRPAGLKLIKQVRGKIRIPFFAIGGINEETLGKVSSCGAKRVAVCSAICKASNVRNAVKKFYNILH